MAKVGASVFLQLILLLHFVFILELLDVVLDILILLNVIDLLQRVVERLVLIRIDLVFGQDRI